MESDNLQYLFKQYETAITAFAGVFEKRIQEIMKNMPVMVLDTGDETFLLKKKYEETKNKELYLPVPRCVLNIGEASYQTDQDSNQYTKIKYRLPNDKIYSAQARRKATTITIGLELVCSNWIYGLGYLEIVQSLFSTENKFTYDWLGNDYNASYKSGTFVLEKNNTGQGDVKNCVVKATIDLEIQPYIIWFNSIKEIGENNNADADQLKTQFEIVAKQECNLTTTPPDYRTTIEQLQDENFTGNNNQ